MYLISISHFVLNSKFLRHHCFSHILFLSFHPSFCFFISNSETLGARRVGFLTAVYLLWPRKGLLLLVKTAWTNFSCPPVTCFVDGLWTVLTLFLWGCGYLFFALLMTAPAHECACSAYLFHQAWQLNRALEVSPTLPPKHPPWRLSVDCFVAVNDPEDPGLREPLTLKWI